MMDMMKKGAALMGAALLTVTLWSTPVMAAVNVPANPYEKHKNCILNKKAILNQF